MPVSVLQVPFTRSGDKPLVAAHEAGAEKLADGKKRGVENVRTGSNGKGLARLGFMAGAQRKLQFQVDELSACRHVLHGSGVPALRCRHFRKLRQVFGRFQLQPVDAAFAVKCQHTEGRTDDHVFDPALPQRQVFQLLRDRRFAQQRMLLAGQRCPPGLLMPCIGLAQQRLHLSLIHI